MSNLNFDLPRPVFLESADIKDASGKTARIPGLLLPSGEGDSLTPFLHFANPKLNLGSHEGRIEAALRAALYKRTVGANIAYGRAVDRAASNPDTGNVALIEDPLLVGMYVQGDQMSRFLVIQMSMNMPGNFEQFVANQVKTAEAAKAFTEATKIAFRQLPITSVQPKMPGF